MARKLPLARTSAQRDELKQYLAARASSDTPREQAADPSAIIVDAVEQTRVLTFTIRV